jgi:hypothetical protein
LRKDYKETPEYKNINRKKSFDNWSVPISALEAWGVLLPDVVVNFYKLKGMRNRAIHFRLETDQNDRELALEAINCIKAIIGSQFSSWGAQPWFITDIPGELYIKRSWEDRPFIKKIYIPNCAFVGPKHRIKALSPRVIINDKFDYESEEISDKKFCDLRNKNQNNG